MAKKTGGEMPRALQAGVAYFGIVFVAGFFLGVIRVGWLVGRVGERTAELAEAPVMLGVIFFAARWLVVRLGVPASLAARALMGVSALVLLLAVELTVVLALRGLTFAEYLGTRDPVAAAVYLVSLGLFAAMPALLVRR